MQGRGYCECGCGERTSLAKETATAKGWVKGQPVRFVVGHNARRYFGPEYIEDPATGCWEWQHRREGGYGKVNGGSDKGSRSAHLVYYERLVGSVPEGLELDHLCRNRCCVNPEHLEPVPHVVNSRRGSQTKLTAEQVAEIRASPLSTRAIAPMYGVHHVTISAIRRGYRWAKATEEA
jgi:hypothetical protein